MTTLLEKLEVKYTGINRPEPSWMDAPVTIAHDHREIEDHYDAASRTQARMEASVTFRVGFWVPRISATPIRILEELQTAKRLLANAVYRDVLDKVYEIEMAISDCDRRAAKKACVELRKMIISAEET